MESCGKILYQSKKDKKKPMFSGYQWLASLCKFKPIIFAHGFILFDFNMSLLTNIYNEHRALD